MTSLDQTAPLSDERRASIVAAYYRSQYEPMRMGVDGLIAWNGVPDLAAEVERLRRENTRLAEDLRRALGEVADHA